MEIFPLPSTEQYIGSACKYIRGYGDLGLSDLLACAAHIDSL